MKRPGISPRSPAPPVPRPKPGTEGCRARLINGSFEQHHGVTDRRCRPPVPGRPFSACRPSAVLGARCGREQRQVNGAARRQEQGGVVESQGPARIEQARQRPAPWPRSPTNGSTAARPWSTSAATRLERANRMKARVCALGRFSSRKAALPGRGRRDTPKAPLPGRSRRKHTHKSRRQELRVGRQDATSPRRPATSPAQPARRPAPAPGRDRSGSR
jgi:hypothetical protein